MIEKIEEDEFLKHFSNMGEAAKFFLSESFMYAEREIKHCVAEELFGQRIQNLEPTKEDFDIVRLASEKLKDATTNDLLNFDSDVLSKWTQDKFSDTWNKAQIDSLKTSMTFPNNKELGGQDLLGHVTNLAFFIEVISNRHVMLLNVRGQLDNFRFNILDDSSVLNRLIYCLKEELDEKKVTLGQVKYLFKLRNFAVHYNLNNAKKFGATIGELTNIWRELQSVVEALQKKENLNDIDFGDIIREFLVFFKKSYVK
ncbi:MAG: hypothetical protein ACK5FG_10395 [Chryseotalea sp.]|jgi:hypothetical protein|nr:hypothetical protein [Cytophagales bacterium]